jgi:hypothetical protein
MNDQDDDASDQDNAEWVERTRSYERQLLAPTLNEPRLDFLIGQLEAFESELHRKRADLHILENAILLKWVAYSTKLAWEDPEPRRVRGREHLFDLYLAHTGMRTDRGEYDLPSPQND